MRASLNQQSKVLVGAAASKGNVQQLLAGKKVFHIATHGIISDDDPMQSFLALASSPGSQDDGRLTAREIYGLKLDADLVFLSACRTGLGRLSGDGVNGLTRPFLYAGASTVIATLSEVADEPSYLLVQSFYRSWLHSHRAADALRSAQLRLLNDLREHKVLTRQSSGPVQLPETPRLWAGFIVVGAPR